jgi:hypothetical protein
VFDGELITINIFWPCVFVDHHTNLSGYANKTVMECSTTDDVVSNPTFMLSLIAEDLEIVFLLSTLSYAFLLKESFRKRLLPTSR